MKLFLLFYMCHFAMGLTHCYKTTVFLHYNGRAYDLSSGAISQLQTAGSDVPWPDIGLRIACVRSTARVCPRTLAVSHVHGRCRDHCQTTRGHCPRRRYPAVYQLFRNGQSDICYSATALHMWTKPSSSGSGHPSSWRRYVWRSCQSVMPLWLLSTPLATSA